MLADTGDEGEAIRKANAVVREASLFRADGSVDAAVMDGLREADAEEKKISDRERALDRRFGTGHF